MKSIEFAIRLHIPSSASFLLDFKYNFVLRSAINRYLLHSGCVFIYTLKCVNDKLTDDCNETK